MIELSNGRLLLAVGRKSGASDFAVGTIIGMFSRDGGASWDDQPHEIQAAFEDVGDVMSISLCRSPRGIHLFFLARGPDAQRDTRIYQLLSSDEGKAWSQPPQRVSQRGGYHIVNNARVIRTRTGRMIVPVAFTDDIKRRYDAMSVFVLCSDDDGQTWKSSNEIALKGEPLMEPGVAECGDASLYMTIRTKLGVLYESRSLDGGMTWADPSPTKLPSPAAPSTVFRDPRSGSLWMFWINRAKGDWKQRTPLSLAVSRDHGQTWGTPRDIENDPRRSFGYVSVDVIAGDRVLLTYYDWHDQGQPSFAGTSLRQRTILLSWFDEQPTPPNFRAADQPVLREDAHVVSANSGLLIDRDRWRLWYTCGTLGPKGETLGISSAESNDRGQTWRPLNEGKTVIDDAYHASVHRDGGGRIVLYAWRRGDQVDRGLYRYVSSDDGKTFELDSAKPLIEFWHNASAAKADGRVSNDAFDLLRTDRGTWDYFAAVIEKATDPRTIYPKDNAAGYLRLIGHATAGAGGTSFSAVNVVLRPDYAADDPYDTQFYGMQVFRRRKFWLGLLFIFRADSQVIYPEWAWSHDGQSWNRTGVASMALGDEGRFDSRMILFGALAESGEELVWLYSGSNWRHNAFRAGEVSTCIGRATLSLRELDAWLDTLPQP